MPVGNSPIDALACRRILTSARSDYEFIVANDVDDGTHNQSYLRAWVLGRAALDSGTGQLSQIWID